MSTSRAKPEVYDKDGLPIYYTLSREKSGCKLIMTARMPKTPTKKSPLTYGRIAYESVRTLPLDATPADIQNALEQHAPTFWTDVFAPQEDASSLLGQWVQASTPADGLPLAIAVAVHSNTFKFTYSASVQARKLKILNGLCSSSAHSIHIGSQNWQFTTVLTDPTIFSSSKLEEGKAILRWICNLECVHGRLSTNPWQDVKSASKPQKNPAILFNQANRDNAYTQGDIDKILTFSSENLSPTPADSKFLALLLVASTGIPLNELCCVTMGDITFKGNTPFSISICKVLQKGKKNQKEQPYEPTNAKNRNLPIPPHIGTLLTSLTNTWQKSNATKFEKQYLLPSNKNKFRHGDPKTLQSWINKTVPTIVDFRPMRTGLGKKVTPSSLLPPYSRLLSTAKNALPYLGFEPDETNYHFGYTQKTTAGDTYCDFGNQGELLRMSLILNSRVPVPPTPNPITSAVNPPRHTTLSLEGNKLCPAGIFTLTFPPIHPALVPKEGYTIAFSTHGGMSLTALFTNSA